MDALLRELLLMLPPERSHHTALDLLAIAGVTGVTRDILASTYRPGNQRPVELLGLTFPNAVGLAAGYDKDARAWKGLGALGFGHVEVGTVTPRPQPGNPPPRVFRLKDQRALINRLGFPSQGSAAVLRRLDRERPEGMVLGVNLGKNKDTPLEEAARDYVALVKAFAPVADYLAVNVSSPNTPGLRRLQTGEALRALLTEIVAARDAQPARRPLFVKLAPDLSDDDLDDALQAIEDTGVDGVIATNTTIARDGIHGPVAQESGGLSGAPLTARALAMTRAIRQRARPGLPLLSVGGILSPSDALARLDAGADLVQLYTGLVYGGAGLVRRIVEAAAR